MPILLLTINEPTNYIFHGRVLKNLSTFCIINQRLNVKYLHKTSHHRYLTGSLIFHCLSPHCTKNEVFPLSKCDPIPIFLRIWSHLLKKSLTKNFIFLCSPDKISLGSKKQKDFLANILRNRKT